MVVQSPYESTVLICNIRLRKGKFSVFIAPICAKDSKTMGFGGVLWVLSFAEERKYHALGMTGDEETDSHTSDIGHWFRMTAVDYSMR